jgi:hypothetical protein
VRLPLQQWLEAGLSPASCLNDGLLGSHPPPAPPPLFSEPSFAQPGLPLPRAPTPCPTAYLIYVKNLTVQSSAVIIVSGFTLLLSLAGMCCARKRAEGASCVLVSYFYLVFFIILAIVYIGLNNLVINGDLEVCVCASS